MRRDGIIYLSKLPIRSGRAAKASRQIKVAESNMTDDQADKGALSDGIEFNPPTPTQFALPGEIPPVAAAPGPSPIPEPPIAAPVPAPAPVPPPAPKPAAAPPTPVRPVVPSSI